MPIHQNIGKVEEKVFFAVQLALGSFHPSSARSKAPEFNIGQPCQGFSFQVLKKCRKSCVIVKLIDQVGIVACTGNCIAIMCWIVAFK